MCKKTLFFSLRGSIVTYAETREFFQAGIKSIEKMIRDAANDKKLDAYARKF